MNGTIEDWDESFLDQEDHQVKRTLQNAELTAIRRARQCGTSYAIWEAGQVKAL